jgi:hypothetical protein
LKEIEAEAKAPACQNLPATPPPQPDSPISMDENFVQPLHFPENVNVTQAVAPILVKTPSRIRNFLSTPMIRKVSPAKHGDAAGQPRKSRSKASDSTRFDYVEVQTPAPMDLPVPSVDDTTPSQGRRGSVDIVAIASELAICSSPVEDVFSSGPVTGWTRGTKRGTGSSRSTTSHALVNAMPQASAAKMSQAATAQNLHNLRSNDSTYSLATIDERPTKRRPQQTSASLGPMPTGQTPAESERSTSPLISPPGRSQTHQPVPSLQTSQTRSRRLVVITSTAEAVSISRSIPARRSFLPTRRQAPVQSISSACVISTTTTNPSGRLTRKSASSQPESVLLDTTVNHHSTAKADDVEFRGVKAVEDLKGVRRSTRKVGLTPPRLAGMREQLYRIGGSPSGECCGCSS